MIKSGLLDAFGLSIPGCTAICGAGGKTSALFRLAHACSSPVTVSNTAHLSVEQGRFADRVFQVKQAEDVPTFRTGLPDGVTLITGEADARGRTRGLGGDVLKRVRQLALQWNVPLLLEADGARGLALKAPADWEPPVPAFVDRVIVCAGMTAIGKPLSEDWVYRPEDFSRLSGIPMNDPVTLGGLARVLLHEQGGQKNIPPGAERIVLLNQADTPELREDAVELARSLLAGYDRVVVASLHGADSLGPKAEVHAVYQPVAGIILAAGSAKRMGHAKQVLEWNGEALVRRAARTALEAGLDPVIVVTGAYQVEVTRALDGLDLRVVNNLDWENGQSTSVCAGVAALPPRVGAAVFLLADQPFFSSQLLQALTNHHANTLASIVAPSVKGQRANPVLFDSRTFADLLALTGDSGGRQVMAKWGVDLLAWEDERIMLDIDDDQDYQQALGQN